MKVAGLRAVREAEELSAMLRSVREAEELSAMLHAVSTGMSVLVEILILVTEV